MKLRSTAVLAVSLLIVLLGAGKSAALSNVPNLAGATPSETRFDSIAAKKKKMTKKKSKKKGRKGKRRLRGLDKDICIWPWTCKRPSGKAG
jgi:hypothetical protein